MYAVCLGSRPGAGTKKKQKQMNTYVSSLQYQNTSRSRVSVRRNTNLSSRKSGKATLGPISNTLFITIIVTITALLYLGQVTKSNNYSFTISELETRKQELIEENQALEIEAARLSSIDKVQQSEVAKALSDPKSTDYVR